MTKFQPKSGYNYTYPLTKEVVSCIPDDTQFGNYQFGYMEGADFHHRYIGRSDTNLKQEIENQRYNKVEIGGTTYTHFKFCKASSAKEAYERECIDFHGYGEELVLDNINHPDKPNGTDYKFPVEDSVHIMNKSEYNIINFNIPYYGTQIILYNI